MSAAKPSTMAVLPTPARPTSTGLFFFFRASVRTSWRNCAWRPMSGSNTPFAGQRRQVAAGAIQDRRARRSVGLQCNHVHAQVAQDAQGDALGFVVQDCGQQVAFFDLGGAFRLR